MHDIPELLWPVFKKKRFAISLKTSDKEVAKIEGAKKEAEWRYLICETKKRIKEAYGAEDHNSMLFDLGVLAVMDGELPVYQPPEPEAPRFDAWIDDWEKIKRASGSVEKSIFMAKSTIRKFSDEIPLDAICRGVVQKWVENQLQSDVSVATIRRCLSELRGYWGYLRSRQLVNENIVPFRELTLPRKGVVKTDDVRRQFNLSEVVDLISAAEVKKDGILADAIRVAAFTGARIEEVCAIRLIDIDDDSIYINGTKTNAAQRFVPIHSMLACTIKRMVSAARNSRDQYLFSGLRENKFGDRSPILSKRFARLRTALGYGDEYVFHSIRMTFTNTLIDASGRDRTVKYMIGHEADDVTGKHYAKKPSLGTMKAVIEMLRYPGYSPE